MSSRRRISSARSWVRIEQPGGFDRGGRLVGEDRQQPQVVRSEPVEAELGQGDHADRHPVVAHRHDEHRFVDVVGARDRASARVGVGVVHQERFAALGDPAGEALADPRVQQGHVDALVRADGAFEGDRHHPIRRLDQVDPRVVVVDDPTGLLDHGPTDLLDRPRPAHPRRGGLEHLELRRATFRLLEQLGVRQRDRGVGRERADERDVGARPDSRMLRDGGQGADHPIVVDQWGHEQAR